MKYHKLKIFASAIIAISLVFVTIYYNSLSEDEKSLSFYKRFKESGELSLVTPGLDNGVTPQGIDYLPEKNWFLFSGYYKNGNPSVLIAEDADTGEIVKTINLQSSDGTPYCGHAGGVCVSESQIYIVSSHLIYRITIDDFLKTPDQGFCTFRQIYENYANASYCCYDNGILWVGEFRFGRRYKTAEDHRTKTADGVYGAYLFGYKTTNGKLARNALPDYVLATEDRVQGVTVKDSYFYLSQSFMRGLSGTISKYKNVLEEEPSGTVTMQEKEIPLYYLDSHAKLDSISCPPMSESMCTVEDSVYIVFESATPANLRVHYGPNHSRAPMSKVYRLTQF